ncbi:MAG TPA: hypothetical protein VFS00_28295, partial [Polyangiaceae bacterium]|nr:hypothetical protein [Polyangiaceae bacterium]
MRGVRLGGPRAAAVALGAIVVGAYLLCRFHEIPWDDAYFFKRFAQNFLAHGSLAWNVDEGPVYGNTSLGFQLLAVALVAAAPGHYFALLQLVAGGLQVLLLRLYLATGQAAPPARPTADAG